MAVINVAKLILAERNLLSIPKKHKPQMQSFFILKVSTFGVDMSVDMTMRKQDSTFEITGSIKLSVYVDASPTEDHYIIKYTHIYFRIIIKGEYKRSGQRV